MAKKKQELPPKPACGSIEKNKIIDAVNKNLPNPCTQNKKCIEYYNLSLKEKQAHPDAYFDFVEPDEYEDALLETLLL